MTLLHDHEFIPHFADGEITRIRHLLRQGMENDRHHRGGHYYARDPLNSLVQSAAHERLVKKEGDDALEYTDEPMGEAFTKWDIAGWIGKVGLSLIWRFLHGRHRLKADRFIRETDRPVYVVHLGDTYYSGTPFEAKRHILALWPVEAGDGDELVSPAVRQVEEDDPPARGGLTPPTCGW